MMALPWSSSSNGSKTTYQVVRSARYLQQPDSRLSGPNSRALWVNPSAPFQGMQVTGPSYTTALVLSPTYNSSPRDSTLLTLEDSITQVPPISHVLWH